MADWAFHLDALDLDSEEAEDAMNILCDVLDSLNIEYVASLHVM